MGTYTSGVGAHTFSTLISVNQDVSFTITDHNVAMMMKQHRKFL